MDSTHSILAVLILVGLIAMGATVMVFPELLAPPVDSYDRTSMTILDENDTVLAAVDVQIADTYRTRYVGLSARDSLDHDQGMLFVHDEEAEHTYVMRSMDFPIDIVFIDAEGQITEIYNAPTTDPLFRHPQYSGVGMYILEVPYWYTEERDITIGDRVVIDR